jgi:radical SAM-linked protein
MVQAADAAFSRGWDLIKVYTMIGLPTETEADLDELVTLVRNILAQGRKYGRKNVNVSVGSFVPKSWTPFQWSPFDGVETLAAKIRYLQDRFRGVRGAKIKSHSPPEAEIECVLSRGDRRMGEVLLEAWKRGARFDGWSEHFRRDIWSDAFAACGIAPERYLRAYGIDEILPWDVLDAALTKKFLKIERIKAFREHETQDCKWGHCYACGVPGNGEDTVLARPMLPAFPAASSAASTAALPAAFPVASTAALPSVPGARTSAAASPAASAPSATLLPSLSPGTPSAYTDKAKGAAYRQKAMPDVAPAARRRPGFGSEPGIRLRYRLTFEKLGDARFLSHRNVMDAFERAVRAAGLPASYSEGFNPRMRLSMGPALALGLESRDEVLDLEAASTLPPDAAERITAKLPPGVRVTRVRALRTGEPPLSKAIRGAAYSMRVDPALREAASAMVEGDGAGARGRAPALQSLTLDPGGDCLRFEVNLDAARGDTATPKKIVEQLFSLSADEIVSIPIVREATLLN